MLAPLRHVQERRAQERVLAERERAAFLTNASALVADSLDTFSALAIVAHNAVPVMADACVIDLMDDDGALMRAAAVHRDPEVVAALAQRYPATQPIHPLLAGVLANGRALLVGRAQAADLGGFGAAAARPVAAILVPLLARGRTVGVISLFSFESGRRFGPEDRALAEDLARRIALGVDNVRLYRAADEANMRFLDLVESLGAIVWEADLMRRHYTFVSGRAVALFGHPLARWHDDPNFWLSVQHADDRARSAAESGLALGEPHDHDLEYRVLTADRRTVRLLDLVRVVRGADGSARHLRGVMIHVNKDSHAALADREGEEAKRHAALGSVAALANAAAHEINNPLAIIMGNLEMFARREDIPDGVAVRTDAMLAAGRRIAGIVGRMRRITRLRSIPSRGDLPAMLDLRRSSTSADA
jgi:PAS domain-containing protein